MEKREGGPSLAYSKGGVGEDASLLRQEGSGFRQTTATQTRVGSWGRGNKAPHTGWPESTASVSSQLLRPESEIPALAGRAPCRRWGGALLPLPVGWRCRSWQSSAHSSTIRVCSTVTADTSLGVCVSSSCKDARPVGSGFSLPQLDLIFTSSVGNNPTSK